MLRLVGAGLSQDGRRQPTYGPDIWHLVTLAFCLCVVWMDHFLGVGIGWSQDGWCQLLRWVSARGNRFLYRWRSIFFGGHRLVTGRPAPDYFHSVFLVGIGLSQDGRRQPTSTQSSFLLLALWVSGLGLSQDGRGQSLHWCASRICLHGSSGDSGRARMVQLTRCCLLIYIGLLFTVLPVLYLWGSTLCCWSFVYCYSWVLCTCMEGKPVLGRKVLNGKSY